LSRSRLYSFGEFVPKPPEESMPDALDAVASVISSGNWVVFAYVDPGTGSYLLQVLLAGLLGAGYAIRHFWTGVRGFFRRVLTSGDDRSVSPEGAGAGARVDDGSR
jgi:hypothetical protein